MHKAEVLCVSFVCGTDRVACLQSRPVSSLTHIARSLFEESCVAFNGAALAVRNERRGASARGAIARRGEDARGAGGGASAGRHRTDKRCSGRRSRGQLARLLLHRLSVGRHQRREVRTIEGSGRRTESHEEEEKEEAEEAAAESRSCCFMFVSPNESEGACREAATKRRHLLQRACVCVYVCEGTKRRLKSRPRESLARLLHAFEFATRLSIGAATARGEGCASLLVWRRRCCAVAAGTDSQSTGG